MRGRRPGREEFVRVRVSAWPERAVGPNIGPDARWYPSRIAAVGTVTGSVPHALKDDQWRICFEWPAGSPGPVNVEITDYH